MLETERRVGDDWKVNGNEERWWGGYDKKKRRKEIYPQERERKQDKPGRDSGNIKAHSAVVGFR